MFPASSVAVAERLVVAFAATVTAMPIANCAAVPAAIGAPVQPPFA